jgi:hypothetical protein
MDPGMKAIFPDKLNHYSEEYGLEDHHFESYARQYGTSLILSASDVVYSLTSLLEAPINLHRQSENEKGHVILDSNEDCWTSNFYVAFDALDP